MTDLLPCPFCGGNAELDTRRSYRKIGSGDLDDAVAVYCLECTADHMACRADHIGLTTNDLVDIVSAAWNRRAPVAGWQPIETAPKDGTRFLTWDSYYGVRMGRAFMRADHDDWLSYVDSNGSSHKGGIRASHWMPLPAASVDGGEDA